MNSDGCMLACRTYKRLGDVHASFCCVLGACMHTDKLPCRRTRLTADVLWDETNCLRDREEGGKEGGRQGGRAGGRVGGNEGKRKGGTGKGHTRKGEAVQKGRGG